MDSACWRLAEALSAGHDVILCMPAITAVSHPGFAVVYYNQRNLSLLARDSDMVLVQSGAAEAHAFFSESGKLFAADWGTIIAGRLPAGQPPAAGEAPADNGGPDFLVWLPPVERKGPVYYFRRLRFHLETLGWRRTARRGWSLVSGKISGRGGR
ncbi:hypothetical protein BMS3Abin01_01011 [bacterium BMS3Abin01]|nr:hypothetical protein BMS3Abin01_01011 [bacterium BMS3Abin01]